ncbi:NAD(P)/FAD-dependent oxidoreductase [Acerihabitans arboris]|uniref:FAD-dependent oxidoreductase n=1 Tax=Acerihabitans arboris TaxID=2691583 RepID=A0A845SDX7_9GAMM|nr:FAD-dependent oxidoreductase [Acerihabitans arboris]NDL63133.1 FAD-dependent oxidoreductase [Acerihabitans arboris]
MKKKIAIVGGGFFGMYIAEFFSRSGHTVDVYEREKTFMSRASYNNQARIHNGYHYPRSILTALRSRMSFPRFVDEFRNCIDDEFEQYYLISNQLGKVTANQFLKFCDRIGAACEPAPTYVQKLTNPSLIEACFSVTEHAFDAHKLRDEMLGRLDASSADYHTGISVDKVRQHQNGLLITLRDVVSEGQEEVYADHVFNCTYSHINYMLKKSNIELISLKHELTEMCLVDVPDELKKIGLTVMCGPFFSVMPFPSAGLHSFSHVLYTPHYEWFDKNESPYTDPYVKLNADQKNSAWNYMRKDAMRYLPILGECRYQRSLWEVKTVLPRSESDDSRPILFRPHHGLRGFHCVMGGKIDNIYDAREAIIAQHLVE